MNTGAPEDHFFVAFDKTPIHYILHETQGTPSATILVIHGAGEYAARYNAFGAYLASLGVRAALLDLRGYGKSGGPRAYVRSFDDFREDALALARKLRTDGTGPLFVLAHSFGALVAVHSFFRGPDDAPRGLILSSPCFGLAFKVPPHIEFFARAASVAAPRHLHPTKVWPENLTHDATVIEDYRADRLIIHSMSSRLYVLMRQTMGRAAVYARTIRCPALLLQAGDDRVVDQTASKAFFDAIPGPEKAYRTYPGHFHEILNETGRKAIYDEILSWIQDSSK